jgi:phosphodiesterase/alkaline phosphatase D-like protein
MLTARPCSWPTIGRRALSATAIGVFAMLAITAAPGTSRAGDANTFQSHFQTTPDRIWPGGAYWPNPMENWRVQGGRLECTTGRANRNVHLLTHAIGQGEGGFNIRVTLGTDNPKQGGAAGFEIGVKSEVDDHRAAVFRGQGLKAVVTAAGELRLGNQKRISKKRFSLNEPIHLTLQAIPSGNRRYELRLSASNERLAKHQTVVTLKDVPAKRIEGAIRLTHNPRQYTDGRGAKWWFKVWQVKGEKIEHHPDRAFGPILWSMYTLTDSRSERGHVLNLSAQMPPLGDKDGDSVAMEIKKDDQWQQIDTEKIDPDARNALFKIDHWKADQKVPYRLVYETTRTDGTTVRDTWRGTIRKAPADQAQVSIADLSCQKGYAFPYGPVADNLAASDPDMLFFAGDQLYEGNGGYGIVRRPAGKAIINYLRQYYMHGWAFREVMRDRPTVCIPDDHDVFQGNIWGEGGAKMDSRGGTSSKGGYIEPVRTVNAIYRTQTSHLPGVESLEPAKRGIRVMYSDIVYGGLSLAVIADRQFKSSPRAVDTGSGRADILKDKDIDPQTLDKPGLKLLGERQLDFLRNWVKDWRGAQMKVLLSQTTFSNPMTHTGPGQDRVIADLDSNGWPQSARDEALRILRKGHVFHLAGDQHLASLVQHGVDKQRDSIWTFCGPAIAVGWPRSFRPDQEGLPYDNRPHGLANTGEYQDGFGNPMYVRAIGNPPIDDGAPADAPGPYKKAHRKASGFGMARFDKAKRTITTEAYQFYAGLTDGGEGRQFPGWPVTVEQKPIHDSPPDGGEPGH